MDNSNNPCCKRCNKILVLISQIYCPLTTSPYHRTLYLFSCINKECWNKSDSWTVIRSQILDVKQDTKKEIKVEDSTGYWNCSGYDDWGDGNDDEIEEVEADTQCTIQQENTVDIEAVIASTSKVSIHGQGTTVADVPFITPATLVVFNEPNDDKKSLQYEQTLLQTYEKQYGIISQQTNDDVKAESYEKVSAKHGNRAFEKFLKRLQRYPKQVLRYNRDGLPLLITSNETDPVIPDCPRCGSKRVFEFQLMPTLIYQLKEFNFSSPIPEFGTVLVYTCSNNCWNDDDQSLEEFTYLQCDPQEENLPYIN